MFGRVLYAAMLPGLLTWAAGIFDMCCSIMMLGISLHLRASYTSVSTEVAVCLSSELAHVHVCTCPMRFSTITMAK